MTRSHLRPLRLRFLAYRLVLLIILVPALVLSPIVGNGVSLIHSHGPDGEHAHELPNAIAVNPGNSVEFLDSWHRMQHEHENHDDHDSDVPDDDRGTVPIGVFVKFSSPARLSSGIRSPDLKGLSTPPSPAVEPWQLFRVDRIPPKVHAFPERPRPLSLRVGIAALLRMSHAILI